VETLAMESVAAEEEAPVAEGLPPKEQGEGEEDARDQFELRKRHTLKRATLVAQGVDSGDAKAGEVDCLLPFSLQNEEAEGAEGEDLDGCKAGEGHNGATESSAPEKRSRAAVRFAMLRSMVKVMKVMQTTAELPMKCGWLERMQSGVFTSRERIWVVLRGRVLRWFASPQDSVPLGRIDFELVPCEVSKQWTPKDEAKGRALAMQKRSRCAGCDVISPLLRGFMYSEAVIFQLRHEGDCEDPATALAFQAENVLEGEAWVDAIQKHISPELETGRISAMQGSNLRSSIRLGQAQKSNSDGRWWMVKSISPAKFAEIARTGDLLLFRSPGTVPGLIRTCSGGHFDHVALLLRLEGGRIGLLEATGNQGVALCGWDEFVSHEWHTIYHEIAMRRVAFDRSEDRVTALQDWAGSVLGKPYSLTFGKLLQRKSISEGGAQNDDAYFCSQLVAEALKVLQVLPRGKSSTQYWPSSFEAATKPPLEALEGCSFDDELTLVFPRSGNKAQSGRDITVRLF